MYLTIVLLHIHNEVINNNNNNNNLFVKRVFHTICSKAHKKIDKTLSNVATYI